MTSVSFGNSLWIKKIYQRQPKQEPVEVTVRGNALISLISAYNNNQPETRNTSMLVKTISGDVLYLDGNEMQALQDSYGSYGYNSRSSVLQRLSAATTEFANIYFTPNQRGFFRDRKMQNGSDFYNIEVTPEKAKPRLVAAA